MIDIAKPFRLDGQVALVTGASSGLGVRFATVLAAAGAPVVLLARRLDRLQEVAHAIEAEGGKALAVQADMTDRDATAAAFDRAEQVFGPVTVLVNNAGIAPTARLLDMDHAHWRAVLDTNLDAVVFAAQEMARRLVAAGKPGSIVNIASILSFGVSKGVSAYAVAKAAVAQATRAMALEFASKSIRVNAIAPGYVITEINRDYLTSEKGAQMAREIPLGRFGREEDLDGALLLLASDAGRFMTGSIIVADGGQMIQLRG
jgi:3-oxoacyl-[acyl-carrier protein] reductase